MNRHSECGNVVFYIFLAIAMLAALSYAVSQSSRGTAKTATDEQNRMRATELIDYGDTVAKAVQTLRLRGTTLATLRFSNAALPNADYGAQNPANALNEVFNSEGGGVVYHQASIDSITTAAEDYKFIGSNEVKGIGTTCGAAACSDLLLLIAHIKPDVCMTINTYNGIDNPSNAPPVDTAIDTAGTFQGTMTYVDTIGDEVSSAAIYGKLAGCFKSTADGVNYFFRVLWQQ
jgi:hypothetical protein